MTLNDYLETIKDIQGDFIEFGVFKGNSFKRYAPVAKKQGKFLIGVDSFQGMGKPTEDDYGFKGENWYPQGKLNSNGYEKLQKELASMKYIWGKDYLLYKGFIPEVLNQIENLEALSFVYIDLDHYMPTVQALDFILPMLNKGGLILFDDYLPLEGKNILASKAILEFLDRYKTEFVIVSSGSILMPGGCTSQLLVRKL